MYRYNVVSVFPPNNTHVKVSRHFSYSIEYHCFITMKYCTLAYNISKHLNAR